MDNNNKTLLFITVKYPFNGGEEFVETEIKYLSSHFKRIIICPLKKKSTFNSKKIPSNCFVPKEFIENSPSVINMILGLWKAKKPLYEELLMGYPTTLNPIVLLNCIAIASYSGAYVSLLKKIINEHDVYLIYSYWCNFGALAGLLSANHNVCVVSRAHGYDLYSYRRYPKYIPFQHYLIRNLRNIYPVSEDGVQYLQKEFPQYKGKIILQRLGVEAKGKSSLLQDGVFSVVSCSNLIPIKRVDLIASAIIKLDFPVHWVHFGDGPEKNKIIEIISNSQNIKIKCSLMGNVSNEEIHNFYLKNKVDLFVNISLFEGVPVSIMEAMAYSIPILATNVGGTSEIVNNKNGFLIKKDITEIELVKIFKKIKKIEKGKIISIRNNSFRMYQEKSNASINYNLFAILLKSEKKLFL